MSEPTGLEPVTPVKITATSATERAAFRRCRRQWFLTTVHHLETMEDNLNFWLGELVHSGLETYYQSQQAGIEDPERTDLALAAYQDAYDEATDKVREHLKGFWDLAAPMYEELGEMGFLMLQGYCEREARLPIGEEVVQVEQRLFVDIRHPATGKVIGKLAVKTDLFVRRYGTLTAVDHKTHGHKTPPAAIDIDDQLTAEVYAGWKSIGEFPDNAIYNALLKKVPEPPARLKGTKKEPIQFSKSRTQATTAALYRETLAEAGLTEEGYEDFLAFLDEREANDETPFFYRDETFRTPGQMAQFERNLGYEFLDMVDVAAHPEKAYPNPGFACTTCPVREICRAMMDESDYDHLIRKDFVVGEPRY